MNRLVTGLVFPAVVPIAMSLAFLLPAEWSLAGEPNVAAAVSVPELSPATAVFEMKYRGLSTLDDPLTEMFFTGWGGGPEGENDPFVQAVKSRIKEYTLVYNESLLQAQWAVLELKDKEPVAFYFDLNADGKFSDNEKLLPAPMGAFDFGFSCAFITPDFLIRTRDQREIPFRYVLVGMKGSSTPYTWGPFCVLEGQAQLAGEPVKLVLYPDSLDHPSFTFFEACSYALFPVEQKPTHVSRSPLSSLIQYHGAFYQLKLSGVHEEGKTVRAVLEKDARPACSWALSLHGKEALKVHVERVTVHGAQDNTILFDWRDALPSLPPGRYNLSAAWVSYGVQRDNDWKAQFGAGTDKGPLFETEAGQIRQVEAGDLTLSVRAMNESDRGLLRSGGKERSVFAPGTPIYLVPQIKGKAGEIYTRFSQKSQRNDFLDVSAHLTILDANGKTVAAADMPYT